MSDPDNIHYKLCVTSPERHSANIEISAGVNADQAVLALPVWSPGSYKVRDYSKQLRDLQVDDGHGRALSFEKIRKNAWLVALDGATTLRARYEVYGYERSVRTNHIDDQHAFLTGPATFLYLEGAKERPCSLEISAPEGWDQECPLDQDAGRYQAANFDTLVDSPIELGPFERLEYEVGGVPHSLVVTGQGNRAGAKWLDDFKRICEVEVALFGELPISAYSFIVHLTAKGGGGLEHKRGSVLQFVGSKLRKRKTYLDYLSLVAHEYFHTWNGKRIRPKELGPFEYDHEVYTRELWVVEGITAYYDELILSRAKVAKPSEFLEMVSKRLRVLQSQPGRLRDSLAAASFDAWIKLYQPDEETVNNSISYYVKGQLVALLLDLEIRRRSADQKSLDDVMRQLWREHEESGGEGYEARRIEAIVAELVGDDVADFFEHNIRSTKEVDFNRYLRHVGLRICEAEKPEPDLGIKLKDNGSGVVVKNVLRGGAGERGGLSARDEIIAVEGRKVSRSEFDERLKDFDCGTSLTLTLFRDGRLLERQVELGEHSELRIDLDPEADEAQAASREAWLGQAWNEEG